MCELCEKAFDGIVDIPKASQKPRQKRITMCLDDGLGIIQTRDILEVAGEYIDTVKVGRSASAIFPMEILEQTVEGIKRAGQLIRDGKLVIWPHEICYGIATTALSREAIENVYELKNRDKSQGFVVVTSR